MTIEKQKPPTREQIAYVIQQKKQGFQIPQDLALEMADAILALYKEQLRDEL